MLSGAIHVKEWRPPLHLGVVAIEKGTFESPSTTVTKFTNLYIYEACFDSLNQNSNEQ